MPLGPPPLFQQFSRIRDRVEYEDESRQRCICYKLFKCRLLYLFKHLYLLSYYYTYYY